MKTYKTMDSLLRHTKGGLQFVVPAGTEVEPIAAEPDYFWVKPSQLPADSMQRHDATYYGIRVHASNVTTEGE